MWRDNKLNDKYYPFSRAEIEATVLSFLKKEYCKKCLLSISHEADCPVYQLMKIIQGNEVK